jgi:CDP-diacylglycerol---glycerol-3-phosphate 3-phosphatidyltransferase
MDLHRHTGIADWEGVSPEKRNIWQRAAFRTNGILTPPNIATSLGFIIACAGLLMLFADRYVLAAVLLAVGRFFDIVDGWIAQATGTKSPFGEAFDAVADKLIVLLAFIALLLTRAAPLWALVLIAVPQIVTSFMIYRKRTNSINVHPSRSGKLGVALSWVAISGFVLHTGIGPKADILYLTCSVLTIVSVMLSGYAALAYARARTK